jgi:hypothetical protein
MQRLIVGLGLGCLVMLCAGGMRLTFWAPSQPVLPPDRIEHRFEGTGWEWTLGYQAKTPHDVWYVPLVRQLEAGGWTRRAGGIAADRCRCWIPLPTSAAARSVSWSFGSGWS